MKIMSELKKRSFKSIFSIKKIKKILFLEWDSDSNINIIWKNY